MPELYPNILSKQLYTLSVEVHSHWAGHAPQKVCMVEIVCILVSHLHRDL